MTALLNFNWLCLVGVALGCVINSFAFAQVPADQYFRIQVIDEETSRGVPLVELETVNHLRYVTDSNGNVAFYEPGLMDRQVFFSVKAHGYEFPADGFGFRGRRLSTVPGDKAILTIQRVNLAQRLYRITGQGIYRDSVILGLETKLRHPLLNAKVMGSDSVVNAVIGEKLYWFWGDTNRPGYPLGNFHVPGAVSLLPTAGGLDPEQGVELDYFVGDDGFAKPTANMPGQGPTWINGLTVFEADGQPELFAMYVKVAKPMKVYERGLVQFNFATNEFEKLKTIPLEAPLYPYGHPVEVSSDSQSESHIYFCDPYPLSRVARLRDDYLNPATYEAYSAVESGATPETAKIERDAAGFPVFRWRKNAVLWTRQHEEALVKLGKLTEQQRWHQLTDVESGKPIQLARGTVNWNRYRKKWVMIAVQSWGTSMLGEVWYAESADLMGPWTKAVKIVTHDDYSFYNVRHHPYFDKLDGTEIFFEGTYTATFSGNQHPTPGYDYNQIMYKLDLRSVQKFFEPPDSVSDSK